MKPSLKLVVGLMGLVVLLLCPVKTFAATASREPYLGKDTAPVTIIEYASLTCSHCATFYSTIMPEIEKHYIDTGKVRFIYRDFPLDAYGLHAATLAHCMPAEQFYPFIKILFKNLGTWIRAPKHEEVLIKYAEMAGLPSEKATSCINDTKMMDELIAVQTNAVSKYDIEATPTFIINDGEEKIVGARSFEDFSKIIDAHLAKKK
ncbi:MAG: DsbA family protein [Alphaproteobacteria bacterium]|nr:DsbA family protein [Alphaproteobacteria bacterium]